MENERFQRGPQLRKPFRNIRLEGYMYTMEPHIQWENTFNVDVYDLYNCNFY